MKIHLYTSCNPISRSYCGLKRRDSPKVRKYMTWNKSLLTCETCKALIAKAIKKERLRPKAKVPFRSSHNDQHSAHYDGPFGWG